MTDLQCWQAIIGIRWRALASTWGTLPCSDYDIAGFSQK